MAIRIGCCLNLPSPPSNTTQLSIRKGEEDRGGCRGLSRAIRVASVVMISLEMMSSVNAVETQRAMAEQVNTTTTSTTKRQALLKWSDKIRTCPPWRLNSLESIVPENLPRPASRRRSEHVSFSSAGDAPPVRIHVGRLTGDCFSM